MIKNSYELLKSLKKQELLANIDNEYWWPNAKSYEVIISALLTQQTKWQNVEKSLQNLKNLNINSLQDIVNTDIKEIKNAIRPSGFYNQKADRLKLICQNIINEFESIEDFRTKVTREWLLNQKGFGFESSDSILCYFANQDVMVIDNYTLKMLKRLGLDMDYHQAQEWIYSGINSNIKKVYELYGYEISLNKLYARMHGKIVEFSKAKGDICKILS
jgi:endonuclease-3 related protein